MSVMERVVLRGRLLPLLSVMAMVASAALWALDGPWIVFSILAIYLMLMQLALEKTGW